MKGQVAISSIKEVSSEKQQRQLFDVFQFFQDFTFSSVANTFLIEYKEHFK
jgi:hypothetical protein